MYWLKWMCFGICLTLYYKLWQAKWNEMAHHVQWEAVKVKLTFACIGLTFITTFFLALLGVAAL